MSFFTFVLAVLSAAWTLVAGWDTVPYTGRWHVIGVDAETSASLGEQAFDEVLAREAILDDGPAFDAVGSVMARLAPHANRLAGRDFDWDYAVLEDPSPNAFALPNGNVAVHTGLLPITGLDDGLAAVIGHELAHVLARHPEERLTQQEFARLGQLAASLLFADGDPAAQAAIFGAFGLGAEYGILRPFSRTHESEADRIGMILMAEACYDPRAAPQVWQRMHQLGGGLPEILSTHPAHSTRIEQLSAHLAEALDVREEAGCAPLPGPSS
ncbi:MAG TPA: M48 family metallopeptidase [Aurantimonas sp.]|nr:M48 family metallopeptidase [Aurantimonas sp.]